jgi:hypothetical protein
MLFSGSDQATLGAAQAMKEHWVKLMRLEQACLVSATAKRLVDDLVFLRNTPVRMMYLFYERDGFQASSPDGLKLLREDSWKCCPTTRWWRTCTTASAVTARRIRTGSSPAPMCSSWRRAARCSRSEAQGAKERVPLACLVKWRRPGNIIAMSWRRHRGQVMAMT